MDLSVFISGDIQASRRRACHVCDEEYELQMARLCELLWLLLGCCRQDEGQDNSQHKDQNERDKPASRT
jgi:hypothetical protein